MGEADDEEVSHGLDTPCGGVMGNGQCDLNTIKIAELEKRLDLHVRYQKEAVDRAASELRERLSTMNEFREQLKDQASKFITRDEMTTQLSLVVQRVGWGVGITATLIGAILGSLIAVATR